MRMVEGLPSEEVNGFQLNELNEEATLIGKSYSHSVGLNPYRCR